MYLLIKTLHILSVTLLIGYLLLQLFLLKHRPDHPSDDLWKYLQTLTRRWFYSALGVSILTGVYLAWNTHLFSSPDDRWLYYKIGGLLLFILWVMMPQCWHRFPPSLQRGMWGMALLLYVLLTYLSTSKPYFLNQFFKTDSSVSAPSASSAPSGEKVEDIEEVSAH
ncbi:SirB2 family protein [Deltaproteobacteria bacterium TL4]